MKFSKKREGQGNKVKPDQVEPVEPVKELRFILGIIRTHGRILSMTIIWSGWSQFAKNTNGLRLKYRQWVARQVHEF